jgi:hypothetical protein
MDHTRLENCPIGDNAVARVSTLALFVLLISLAQTRAEVRTDSVAGSETGHASVAYTTGDGVSASQYASGNYSYAPGDGLAGHQFFNQNVTIFGTPVGTTGMADLFYGVFYADAVVGTNSINIGPAVTSTKVEFLDTVTFRNSTGQPAPITVNWKVEGTLSATSGAIGSHADYQTEFRLDGPGLSAVFGGSAIRDNDPSHSDASTSATGWQSSSVQPFGQGYGGAAFSGTLTLPTAGLTFSLSAYLLAEARGDRPASSYGNSAALTFTLPKGVSFTSTDGLLTAGSRMVNIATRAKVLGGDSVAIGGFIIKGIAPKKVIIRGIGPSLTAVGVPGALSDPTLELLQRNATLATNDNWKDSQQAEIQYSGIPPTNDQESAIVGTLFPDTYTVILRGKNDGTGVGLVEVYDLDPAADSRLGNISTRAIVEAGDNVLIGGIIGGGNGSQPKVLIRAIGPSLTQFGVPNALQDPILELRDKNGALVATNNNWQSDQQAAIQATGLAPSNAKEAAILATLEPTNYTAIVKGANNGTGVGLVEVYHLQ